MLNARYARFVFFVSLSALIGLPLFSLNPFAAYSQDPPPQRIESDDPLVTQEGAWQSQAVLEASGGSYLFNSGGVDDALTLEFSGSSIEIFYGAGPTLGTLAIEVDGSVLRTLITTSDQTAYQQSALINYLTDEAHTLRVYSTAGVVAVDAFAVAAVADSLDAAVARAIERHSQWPGISFRYLELGRTVEGDYAVIYATPSDPVSGSPILGRNDLLVATRSPNGWQVAVPGENDYQAVMNLFPPSFVTKIDPAAYEEQPNFTRYPRAIDDYELPWTHQHRGVVTRSFNVGTHEAGEIDFDIDDGNLNVVAAKNGTIIYVNDSHWRNTDGTGAWWYWNTVVIQHAAGEYTTYAHLAQNSVPQWIKNQCSTNYGQANCNVPIQAGQVIAVQGNTGNSSASHLHMSGGQTFVPQNFTDNLDEDGDGNTGEAIGTGYGWSLRNFSFVGYTIPQVGGWVNGTELFANHANRAVPADTELVINGTFNNGFDAWQAVGDPNCLQYSSNNALELWRNSNCAGAVIQRFNYTVPNDARFAFAFTMVNPTANAKRIRVRLHEAGTNNADMECNFWMPTPSGANSSVRFLMWGRNSSGHEWADIELEIRPMHSTNFAEHVIVDSITARHLPVLEPSGTQCMTDPLPGLPANINAVGNGEFSQNSNGWSLLGSAVASIQNGALALSRSANTAGAINYTVNYAARANRQLNVGVDLQNPTTQTLQIRVALHITDLTGDTPLECTFTIAPNTPTRRYVVRGRQPNDLDWSNMTVHIQPTQASFASAVLLDNVTVEYVPTLNPNTTECLVGSDTLTLFNPSLGYTSRLNTPQDLPPAASYNSYAPGVPSSGQWVMGDWNGDGQKTPGVYGTNGVFYTTNDLGATANWTTTWFGLMGRPPVAGRFSASSPNDCIGVVDNANFPPYGTAFALYFTCNLAGGNPTKSFQWLSVVLPDSQGYSGAHQFASGDFNGDGLDSVAIRRGAFVAFTDVPPTTQNSEFSRAQYFGTPHANDYGYFLAGDWDNNSLDSFGVFYQNGYFYRRNDLDWNSSQYILQRVGQPIGASGITATAWRQQ